MIFVIFFFSLSLFIIIIFHQKKICFCRWGDEGTHTACADRERNGLILWFCRSPNNTNLIHKDYNWFNDLFKSVDHENCPINPFLVFILIYCFISAIQWNDRFFFANPSSENFLYLLFLIVQEVVALSNRHSKYYVEVQC